MKRVMAACICQTLHFMLKEDIEHAYAAKLVMQEVEQYKLGLEKNHIKHKIIEESTQPDDSIIIKIIKQYNQTQTGDYLN